MMLNRLRRRGETLIRLGEGIIRNIRIDLESSPSLGINLWNCSEARQQDVSDCPDERKQPYFLLFFSWLSYFMKMTFSG